MKTFWILKESNHERLDILGCYRSTSYDNLCQHDLRSAVGWVPYCVNHESGVVICALELGASATFGSKNYHLDDFSSYHGRVVDLGIFLAHSWALGRIFWYRCLDSSGSRQFVSSLPVDLLS